MFHPDDESLAAVALGEDAGLTEEQLEHVRSCGKCSATVESVRHTARLARAGATAQPLVPPPVHVWSRIEAALDAGDARPAAPSATPRPPAADEPSRADRADPAERPEEAGQAGVRSIHDAPSRERRGSGRLPLGWATGLAAAGVAIGLLTGRALWQETPAPATSAIATAELDTLDTQQRLGEAALLRTDRGIDLRVATSRLDPGDGYLEVWLINTDGKRMVSVGVLRGDAPETFPVSQALIDAGYVVVDISREGFDERPEHSGDSLARGTLPT